MGRKEREAWGGSVFWGKSEKCRGKKTLNLKLGAVCHGSQPQSEVSALHVKIQHTTIHLDGQMQQLQPAIP